MKKILSPAISVCLLAGCVTTQSSTQQEFSSQSTGSTLTERLNASVATVANAIVPNSLRVREESAAQLDGRTHLKNIEINNIIANSNNESWPRVALTINKLPKWFYGIPPSGTQGRYSPKDCMTISMTVWTDQKTSKKYDNVEVCGTDIVKNVPFSDIGLIWKNFASSANTKNTGTQRTNGPFPPSQLFPNKPGLDLFFQFNGNYYVGSVMSTLGYNWNETQDARFWIVNLPTQADVARQQN